MSNEPTPRTDAIRSKVNTIRPDGNHRADFVCNHADQLERELTAVTAQRDSLAEALRVATAYPLSESWYKQAIDALAKLKPCD